MCLGMVREDGMRSGQIHGILRGEFPKSFQRGAEFQQDLGMKRALRFPVSRQPSGMAETPLGFGNGGRKGKEEDLGLGNSRGARKEPELGIGCWEASAPGGGRIYPIPSGIPGFRAGNSRESSNFRLPPFPSTPWEFRAWNSSRALLRDSFPFPDYQDPS